MHNASMAIQITIRNVPEPVRNELAIRAAQKRQSMQEYLLTELERLARRPSVESWLREVRERKQVASRDLSPTLILKHRDTDRR